MFSICACNISPIDYTLTEINTTYGRIISPVYFDNHLFMAVSKEENDNEIANTLVDYNLNQKEYTKLFESEFELANIQGIQVNKDWLIWEDMNIYGTIDNIWIMNRKTKESQKINTIQSEEPSFTVPVLIDNYVFWIEEEYIDNEKIKGSIKRYDCVTKELTSIHDLEEIGLNNLFLEKYDSMILWSDTNNGQSYYFIYDIYSHSINKIKTTLEYASNPILIHNYLISNEYNANYSKTNAYIYSLETGESRELNINLRGYYSFKDKILTNNGQDVIIYQINNDLTLTQEINIKNNNYNDYYVYNNNSLIFISNKDSLQNVTLYLFEE